jgi:hypothetical protein
MKFHVDVTENEAWIIYKRGHSVVGKHGRYYKISIDNKIHPHLDRKRFSDPDLKWISLLPKRHQGVLRRLNHLFRVTIGIGLGISVIGAFACLLAVCNWIDISLTPWCVGTLFLGICIICYSTTRLDQIRACYKHAKSELMGV